MMILNYSVIEWMSSLMDQLMFDRSRRAFNYDDNSSQKINIIIDRVIYKCNRVFHADDDDESMSIRSHLKSA